MKSLDKVGLIEPMLEQLRIFKVRKYIPKGGVLVDIGCGDNMPLLKSVSSVMKKCIGIDIDTKPKKMGNISVLQMNIQKKIDLPSGSADAITLLAVLEHLKYPEDVLKECKRILKPGGVLLVTVPSPANEPLLNILSVFMLVRREMIHQHENYFTPKILKDMCKKVGFSSYKVELFELGFNTFLKAIK